LDALQLRLLLASHLALYLRTKLETEKGYTATVGISTNKVLAKLVGNVHKPNSQTTLWQPCTSIDGNVSTNVALFMDDHEIGKVPGIGFKIAQKLRAHVLQRAAEIDTGLIYGGTKENVSVRQLRQHPGMGPLTIEKLLGGAGAIHNIGTRIWELLNGLDSTEVGQARGVPTQISIEDSYIRLDTLSEVTKELRMLATSLLNRMHTDLVEHEDDDIQMSADATANLKYNKRWLAHPKTIRLSTRPRPPQNPDGSRNRSFARISKSAPMPSFMFSFKDDVETIVERLINETLVPLFRRLHPEKCGWNLSLVNIAAANMVDAASEKGGVGRDIAKMFRQQDDVLKQWKVHEDEQMVGGEERHDRAGEVEEQSDRIDGGEEQYARVTRQDQDSQLVQPQLLPSLSTEMSGSEDIPTPSQQTQDSIMNEWDSEDEDMGDSETYLCERCGALMPLFAQFAHERFHAHS
jgi:DNA polymerase iota